MQKSHEKLRVTRDGAKTLLRHVTILSFAALLLSACGGGANEETDPSSTAQDEGSGASAKILATTSQGEGISFCYAISNTTKTNYTYYRFYVKENGEVIRGINVQIDGKIYTPGSAGRVEVALNRSSSGTAALYRNRIFNSLKKITYGEDPTANYCSGSFTDGSLSKTEAQRKYGANFVDNSAKLYISPTDDSLKNDPIAGQGARFTINASNADSFTWDFGDESSIEGPDKVTHVYAKSGSYTVSVIAKKANTYVSTTTRTVKVLDPLSPRKLASTGPLANYVSISLSSSFIQVGDLVTVTAGGWTEGSLTSYLKGYLNTWGVKVDNTLESSVAGFPDQSFTFRPTKSGMHSVVGCKDTSSCFAVESVYVYPKGYKPQAPTASSDYAQRMIWLHNEARDNVSPAAKVRLYNMTWNQSLAEVAQQWANLCPGGHNSGRSAMIPGLSGENIIFTSRYYSNDLELAESGMSAFLNEGKYYHIADNTCDTNEICGHYKQVVAEQALEFGCSTPAACAKFNTDENSLAGVKNMTNGKVMVCNYRSGILSSSRPYITAD